MQLLLRKSGYNFHTTAEKEIVRNIKEKTCYVAFDPQKEEELLESEKSSKAVQFSYKLPDGNVIDVSNNTQTEFAIEIFLSFFHFNGMKLN